MAVAVGRENAASKGRRLVAEGRLTVTELSRERVVAECKGDSGAVYRLGWTDLRWACDCPARSKCAHLTALQLVVVR